jgi:hypothetical protein
VSTRGAPATSGRARQPGNRLQDHDGKRLVAHKSTSPRQASTLRFVLPLPRLGPHQGDQPQPIAVVAARLAVVRLARAWQVALGAPRRGSRRPQEAATRVGRACARGHAPASSSPAIPGEHLEQRALPLSEGRRTAALRGGQTRCRCPAEGDSAVFLSLPTTCRDRRSDIWVHRACWSRGDTSVQNRQSLKAQSHIPGRQLTTRPGRRAPPSPLPPERRSSPVGDPGLRQAITGDRSESLRPPPSRFGADRGDRSGGKSDGHSPSRSRRWGR